jgi:methylmalonyl-CoA mutase N-terminal domain/subunit
MEKQKDVVVGVNKFVDKEQTSPTEVQEVDPDIERRQIERLKAFKEQRDDSEVQRARQKLRNAAEANDNVMPVIVEAVKANVTLGEVSNTLRDVFGEHSERITV